MAKIGSGGRVRKLLTRMLATGALLAIYAAGTVATTGIIMATGVTPATAQRGRGRGRGNVGAAIGAGIAIGIIGGAIAADQARRHNSAVEYCMRRFRSYNPYTGTYMGYDGFERPCP
jgi:BA14K-like protein